MVCESIRGDFCVLVPVLEAQNETRVPYTAVKALSTPPASLLAPFSSLRVLQTQDRSVRPTLWFAELLFCKVLPLDHHMVISSMGARC